jgi:hypothetical protein
MRERFGLGKCHRPGTAPTTYPPAGAHAEPTGLSFPPPMQPQDRVERRQHQQHRPHRDLEPGHCFVTFSAARRFQAAIAPLRVLRERDPAPQPPASGTHATHQHSGTKKTAGALTLPQNGQAFGSATVNRTFISSSNPAPTMGSRRPRGSGNRAWCSARGSAPRPGSLSSASATGAGTATRSCP